MVRALVPIPGLDKSGDASPGRRDVSIFVPPVFSQLRGPRRRPRRSVTRRRSRHTVKPLRPSLGDQPVGAAMACVRFPNRKSLRHVIRRARLQNSCRAPQPVDRDAQRSLVAQEKVAVVFLVPTGSGYECCGLCRVRGQ